ncbi:hypothetical protein [Kineococcus radiotolerans]|uniref:Uncharacterized protein n=1 Tax=Kineococcus radiotolerans (strain ATCC BAA-149 / DSM 14245 / SRS30216) TaxID=266940 RepID=A6W8T8_KINRD|nr:hypothetical protein [Kineococcus radiotolerans]ABS03227.1 hypothetical protein Krad_1741 [Kineococcus radiotolerans SRS30216 = ATCC BAA-149]
MSVYSTSTTPRARIEHRCDQCARTIPVGETYSRWEGVTGDGWHTNKACQQCDAYQRALFDEGIYDEDEYGSKCYPWLSDVDWSDFADDPLWVLRRERFRQQWAGQPFPIALDQEASRA